MQQPFAMPLCPIPIWMFMFFNIIIKLATSGVVKPVFDQFEQKVNTGKDFAEKLAEDFMKKAGGGAPAFLEGISEASPHALEPATVSPGTARAALDHIKPHTDGAPRTDDEWLSFIGISATGPVPPSAAEPKTRDDASDPADGAGPSAAPSNNSGAMMGSADPAGEALSTHPRHWEALTRLGLRHTKARLLELTRAERERIEESRAAGRRYEAFADVSTGAAAAERARAHAKEAVRLGLSAEVMERLTSGTDHSAEDAADAALTDRDREHMRALVRSEVKFDAPPWVVEMRKAVYDLMVVDLTDKLSVEVHTAVTDSVAPQLHEVFSEDLSDFLNHSISHGLLHSVGAATGTALTFAVPHTVNHGVPDSVTHQATQVVTSAIAMGVTHSLVPTLIHVLRTSSVEKYYCYYCERYGWFCDRGRCPRSRISEFYGDYFAAYYSEHYSGLMGVRAATADGFSSDGNI